MEVLEDLVETGSLFWLDAVMAELHEFDTPSEERRDKSRALRERLSRQDAINESSWLCKKCFAIQNLK